MVAKTGEMTKTKIEKAKADSGYFSKEDFRYSKEKGIDLYMPDQMKSKEEQEERENKIGKHDRRNFTYDEQDNKIICPENKILFFKGIDKTRGPKYICKDCERCPA
ncbi:hypothetical protein A2Y83_03890 [Candidatus Falkowbacteria bacterium RBG_13_39_14]|uniref:Transposase DDE domain-containing protein n=1 Tax=Candidatus Falkowbacteria bacterium RBG_13_39_14 TaxID=1797985 RepID=A0A1F5S8I9_9BACT|nr:MAG: hypothetical protein A2Y83_03890 [Candidatus Falkowbacteria bacterium RBG_13_39_14]